MIEQLDLWLAAREVTERSPVCDHVRDRKGGPGEFRKDYRKATRKSTEEIFEGEKSRDIVDVAKYAPSACNTQPWLVRSGDEKLSVYRILGSWGVIPARFLDFYNKTNTGIFLLFLS